MNKWTKLSMQFTYDDGYLDKLLEIYPIKANPIRKVPESLVKRINLAYDDTNYQELINLFNEGVKKHDLKFPIACSYNSSLRNETRWIEKNPITVNKIGELLMNIDKEVLLDRCAIPKKTSRQMGPLFTKWFKKKFGSDREIGILGITDTDRKMLAKVLTKYKDNKGLDLMVLINNINVFGEAKFISASGGSQSHQFINALDIFHNYKKKKNVLPIAILDGNCWRECKDKFYLGIKNSKDNEIIISALLLEKLFEKIKEIDVPDDKLSTDEIIGLL